MHKQKVTFALPQGATWYNYFTKESEPSTPEGKSVSRALNDLEQAVFVRGGSILPIKEHKDCMALLPCMLHNIWLEVYPDTENKATGSLYLDDGYSYEF